MTVGMFLESVTGKAAALRGNKMDGSAFVGEKLEDVKGVLEAADFKYSGKRQCMMEEAARHFQLTFSLE